MTHELRLRHPATLLYVQALSAAWRNGVPLTDPSIWLAKEPDIDAKLMRDADIAAAVNYRRHLIAGRTWDVVPKREGDKRAAVAKMVIGELLGEIKNFETARFNLAFAFLSGARFAEIVWDRMVMPLGDNKPREWWVPVQLIDMDKKRFQLRPVIEDGKLKSRWEGWNVVDGTWRVITKPGRYVKNVYQLDEGTLSYGRGLRDALGWWWYAKEHIFQETLQAVERFGQGIITAKVDGLRDANASTPNEELIRLWTRVLEDMRARNILVYDAEDEVEFISMSGEGHQLMSSIRDDLTDSIRTLILGGTLNTGGGSEDGGSYAKAVVHESATEALIHFDREILDGTLSEDLVTACWIANAANMRELRLPDHPNVRYATTQEDQGDPNERVNSATALLGAGVELAKSDVYEQTGWRQPEVGEETIKGGGGPPAGGFPGQPGAGGPVIPGAEPTRTPVGEGQQSVSQGQPQEQAAQQMSAFQARVEGEAKEEVEVLECPDTGQIFLRTGNALTPVHFGTYSVRIPDRPEGQPRCDEGQPTGGEYAPQGCEGGGGNHEKGRQTENRVKKKGGGYERESDLAERKRQRQKKRDRAMRPDESKDSISTYIRKSGGLALEGSRGELESFRGRGRTLIRKNGMGLDEARAAAVEGGYLEEDSTVSDFLDMIDDDMRGNRRYSKHKEWDDIVEQSRPDEPEATPAQLAEEEALWLLKQGKDRGAVLVQLIKGGVDANVASNAVAAAEQRIEEELAVVPFKKPFDESKVARVSKGSSEGGRFAPKGDTQGTLFPTGGTDTEIEPDETTEDLPLFKPKEKAKEPEDTRRSTKDGKWREGDLIIAGGQTGKIVRIYEDGKEMEIEWANGAETVLDATDLPRSFRAATVFDTLDPDKAADFDQAMFERMGTYEDEAGYLKAVEEAMAEAGIEGDVSEFAEAMREDFGPDAMSEVLEAQRAEEAERKAREWYKEEPPAGSEYRANVEALSDATMGTMDDHRTIRADYEAQGGADILLLASSARMQPWNRDRLENLKASVDAWSPTTEAGSATHAKLTEAIGELPADTPEWKEWRGRVEQSVKAMDRLSNDMVPSLADFRQDPTQENAKKAFEEAHREIASYREEWAEQKSALSSSKPTSFQIEAAKAERELERAAGVDKDVHVKGSEATKKRDTEAFAAAHKAVPNWHKDPEKAREYMAMVGVESTWAGEGGAEDYVRESYRIDLSNKTDRKNLLNTQKQMAAGLLAIAQAGFGMPGDGMQVRQLQAKDPQRKSAGYFSEYRSGGPAITMKHTGTEEKARKRMHEWINAGQRGAYVNSSECSRVSAETGVDRTVATAVHEIGHLYHHRGARQRWAEQNPSYSSKGSYGGFTPSQAWTLMGIPNTEMGAYGRVHSMEYVAETFTRMVFGMPVSSAALKLYKDLGGFLPK